MTVFFLLSHRSDIYIIFSTNHFSSFHNLSKYMYKQVSITIRKIKGFWCHFFL